MNTLSKFVGMLCVLAGATMLACGATDSTAVDPPFEETKTAPARSAAQADETEVTRATITRGDDGWVVQGSSSEGDAVTLSPDVVLLRDSSGGVSELEPGGDVQKFVTCYACACEGGYCVCVPMLC